MLAYLRKSFLPSSKPSQKRSARPLLENLEERLLLYSAYGGTWAFGSRITYSFMPDGTSVGGTPSALFQTMNAKFATATWEAAIEKAASVWEAVANINLALVSDNGSPEACNGDQQDDPRFGDIRIGAVNLGTGGLGETFLPPPFNGGTVAGDIFLNSNPIATWNINSAYDLETVAIHEFGHALGLGESQVTTACMYAYYNGTKQSLTSDDIAGIQSVWGAPQPDQFNSNGQSNGTFMKAANLNSYIASNGQVAIPSLDMTTGSQSEWFSVTVPSSNERNTWSRPCSRATSACLSPTFGCLARPAFNSVGSANSTAFGATVTVPSRVCKPARLTWSAHTETPLELQPAVLGWRSISAPRLSLRLLLPTRSCRSSPIKAGGSQEAEVGLLEIGNVTALGYMLPGNLPNIGSGVIEVPLNPLQLSVQTSADQSSAIDGLAALVAGTNIAQPQLIGGVVSLTATGSQNPSTLDSGSTPSILQAVDYLIMNWNDSGWPAGVHRV